MKDYIEEYLFDMEAEALSKATLKNKRTFLNHFANWYGKNLEDVKPIHVKKYIKARLDKGIKPTSINTCIKQLKVFFQWCIENDYLDESPMEKVKLLRQERTMIKAFSDSDIKALFNHYNGKSYLQVRNKTIVTILIETGIRNSELRNIKLDDVIHDSIIVKGKGKTRTVPISNQLKKQLLKYNRVRDKYPKATQCPYLIVSTMGGQISIDVPLDVLKTAGEAVGINVRILVHSVRRYYAQKMLNNTDIFTLSRLLGHSSLSTTQIYLQSTEDSTIIQRGMNSPLSNM